MLVNNLSVPATFASVPLLGARAVLSDAGGGVDAFRCVHPGGITGMPPQAVTPPAVRLQGQAAGIFGSLSNACNGPILSLSTFASAGFNGAGNISATNLLIGGVIFVAVTTASVVFARRVQGHDLARIYYGNELERKQNELRTCKKGYRGCVRDDIKLLVESARAVDRVVKMKKERRPAAISQLLGQWELYAQDSCYAIKIPAGAPARALRVLAERVPDSFTREQYVKMANVGAGGYVPSYGSYLMKAAGLLKPGFGELEPGKIVTAGDGSAGAIADTLSALDATGGIPRDISDQVLSGGAGVAGTVVAAIARAGDIEADLGRKSRTDLIRTGKKRVKEFKDQVRRGTLDDASEEAIITRQAVEMFDAVVERAAGSAVTGQDAVAELVEELARIYPGASNRMSYWLMTPTFEALEKLANEHPDYLQREDIVQELQRMGGIRGATNSPEALTRILGVLDAQSTGTGG